MIWLLQHNCIQICKHKAAILSKCPEQRHCDNRCEKFLLCNHQCFGFCGEPCPPLCWICDRGALMTNAFSKDTVVYPLDPRLLICAIFFKNFNCFIIFLKFIIFYHFRFILLRRCGHIFESRSLGRWLQWQDSRIEIKTCPRCNLNIDGQGHFSGQIFYPVIDRTLINLNNKSHPSKAKMLLDILGSCK
jgi:hypothetical protein